MEEDFLFDITDKNATEQVFVLIIYDIIDNAKRVKLSKYLQGYGFRIQKSAFEAIINKKKYEKLLKELPAFVSEDDSIRAYRIQGKGQVTVLGKQQENIQEDIIVI